MKNTKRLLSLLLCLLMSVSVVFPSEIAYAGQQPSNVSGFSVKKFDTSSVTLKWKKVKGADGYIISRYNSSTKKWVKARQIKNGSTTTAKISKLTDGSQYKFKIYAYRLRGKTKVLSARAVSLSAYTRLKAPEGFTAVRKNLYSVKLSWKKVKRASGYIIEYKTISGEWKRLAKITENETASYSVSVPSDSGGAVRIKSYRKINKKTCLSKAKTADFPKAQSSISNATSTTIFPVNTNNISQGATTSTDKYTVSELYCYNGTQKIYGKMYLPTGKAGRLPTVILSPSHSLTCDTMNSYCVMLAEQGYAAYSFDFCGGSNDSRSDGSMNDMTVFTEVSDLKAVISQIRVLDYIDENNLFLLGTSQGGLVSALTADDLPELIKGMILMYPAFNIADQMSFFGDNIPENGMTTPISGTIGHDYIVTIKDYDIYANIAGFKKDVLIIHGTSDNIVPISYSERAIKTYSSAELKTIDDAGHGFNKDNYSLFKDYDEQVNPLIIQYLSNHIS